MLGIATACIGLSLNDFCRLTPDEFSYVCKAYTDTSEMRRQESWERARAVATLTVQPHLKHQMSAGKLMPFPWDDKAKPSPQPKPKKTKEEEKAIFERLAKRF